MKHVNNILFAFILPLMILSFTGASIHLHVCAKTGEVVSHIQLPEHQPQDEDHSCCCGHDQDRNNCCDAEPIPAEQSENDHSHCCLSIIKIIETDREYNFSKHNYQPDPVVLTSLFQWKSQNFDLQRSDHLLPDPDTFISPTKLHPSIVLLI